MAVVLDASLALAWQFEDEESEYAERVLDRLANEQGVVPCIWLLEVANTLTIAERRGRLTSAKVAAAVEAFEQLAIIVDDMTVEAALGPVLALARSEKLSAYDASYLELAMREGLPLATQDASLQEAATRLGVELVA